LSKKLLWPLDIGDWLANWSNLYIQFGNEKLDRKQS